jgi:hypothetical protein
VRSVEHAGTHFRVETGRGTVTAAKVVVATGGLTVPKIGATPFAYRLAEQFGLAIVAPQPALVPLALEPSWLADYAELAGVSLDVEAACAGGKFRESLLFTHRGLSGPAILQVSSYWQQANAAQPIRIDLLPGVDARAWLALGRQSKATLSGWLAERMPKRLAQRWCEARKLDVQMAQLPQATLETVAQGLEAWIVKPAGTLGYNKAEVTLGGVDTRGLSSKTLEAAKLPGLHFIGEAVDVTGHLGGFNFQWAWASAHACANAL